MLMVEMVEQVIYKYRCPECGYSIDSTVEKSDKFCPACRMVKPEWIEKENEKIIKMISDVLEGKIR